MTLTWRDSGTVGHAAPLVFLHAFPLDQSMWDPQFDFFSSSRRIITLDWPGFGHCSLGELTGTGGGLEPYARHVLRLLDLLEIERANICGLSMGGYAALALFRLAPERVASLILCDTRATADPAPVKQGRYETAERLSRLGIEAVDELVRTMAPRLLGETTLSRSSNLVSKIEGMIRQNGPAGIARALTALAERPDSTDLLSSISNRENGHTLIIVGNEDKLTPPSEMEMMSKDISGSTFRIIEGAGHLPNLEQSLLFNNALGEFLL